MTRLLKWDYDNDEVIEYKRLGECNQCGDCCTTLIRYKMAGKRTPGNVGKMGDHDEKIGVWSEYQQRGMRRFISLLEIGPVGKETPCAMMGETGCMIQAKKSLTMKGEAALCEAWPIIPEHVTPFERCSYSFEEIGRWKISELGK